MPLISRRKFINTAALATTTANFAQSALSSIHENLPAEAAKQEDRADTIEFSSDELARMFNNRKFPPRPYEPCPLPRSPAIKNVRYMYRIALTAPS